jgi:hypothetical protein
VNKGNALRLCGKKQVMLGSELGKLLCALLGKFNVTEEDKRTNIKLIADRTKRKISLKSGNLHSVNHNKLLKFSTFILYIGITTRILYIFLHQNAIVFCKKIATSRGGNWAKWVI